MRGAYPPFPATTGPGTAEENIESVKEVGPFEVGCWILASLDWFRNTQMYEVPQAEVGEPQSVASVVSFLCKPDAHFISGKIRFIKSYSGVSDGRHIKVKALISAELPELIRNPSCVGFTQMYCDFTPRILKVSCNFVTIRVRKHAYMYLRKVYPCRSM